MVEFNDFKREDGSIDWEACRKAEVAAGERCKTCGSSVYTPRFGISIDSPVIGPKDCGECSDIGKPEELSHSQYFRCPKCGHFNDPGYTENYKLFEDGEHEVGCGECDHDFTVSTSVSYDFTSPAMIQEDVEEDEDDQDVQTD